jgi:hypothetical protein
MTAKRLPRKETLIGVPAPSDTRIKAYAPTPSTRSVTPVNGRYRVVQSYTERLVEPKKRTTA